MKLFHVFTIGAFLLLTWACAGGTGGLNAPPGSASGPAQADAGSVQPPAAAAAPTMVDSTVVVLPEVTDDNFAKMDCELSVSNPPCLRQVGEDPSQECPTRFEFTGTLIEVRKEAVDGDCSAYRFFRVVDITQKAFKTLSLPANCAFTATVQGDADSKFYFYLTGAPEYAAAQPTDGTFKPCGEDCIPSPTTGLRIFPAAPSSCQMQNSVLPVSGSSNAVRSVRPQGI